MNIALIAHDAKKGTDGAVLHCLLRTIKPSFPLRNRNNGKNWCRRATGLQVQRFLSGPQGGDQQIAARIACNEVDLLLFFP